MCSLSSSHTVAPQINVLTIDLEDWFQSVYDPSAALTGHFQTNTERLLQILSDLRVHATFFVLGLAAEKAPSLIRDIQAAGHEIQSHGFAHQLIDRQTQREFLADVDRAKKLLEDLIGCRVVGYRAPAFSITRKTLWALDVLVQCGMEFDSSIFPVAMRRYGISDSPRTPYHITTPAGYQLLELPVPTLSLCGMRLPTGGGGYLRLLPYRVMQRGISQLNRMNAPAVLYMHPYELNPHELSQLPARIPWFTRMHQGLGRGRVEARLKRLLTNFRFSTLSHCVRQMESAPDLRLDLSTKPAIPTQPIPHSACC